MGIWHSNVHSSVPGSKSASLFSSARKETNSLTMSQPPFWHENHRTLFEHIKTKEPYYEDYETSLSPAALDLLKQVSVMRKMTAFSGHDTNPSSKASDKEYPRPVRLQRAWRSRSKKPPLFL